MGSKHIYWNNEHVNIIRITISIRINNGCILSIQRKRSNILASILVFYAKIVTRFADVTLILHDGK